MSRISAVIISFFSSFLLSCGGGGGSGNSFGGNGPPVLVTANPDSQIVGTWDGTCRDEALQSVNNVVLYGADGSYSFQTNIFANRNCTELMFTDVQGGAFFEGESRFLADGRLVTDLDTMLVEERNFTPQTQEFADSFNSAQFCGFDDWQPGVTKNVFGCQEGLLVALTFDSFTIYHLQDDYFLYFGAGDGLASEGRPDELRISPVLFRRSEEQNFPQEIFGLWGVIGTGSFLEFRPNSVIYIYTEVPSLGGCYDAGPLHVRSVGPDNYVDFEGVNLSIEPGGIFTNVRSPELDLDVVLIEMPDIDPGDILICDS